MPGGKHDIAEFRQVLPGAGIIQKSMTDPGTSPRGQAPGTRGRQRPPGGPPRTAPGRASSPPFKKPRGGQLAPDQKESDCRLSSKRVTVEHVMGDRKECRILRGPYRGPPPRGVHLDVQRHNRPGQPRKDLGPPAARPGQSQCLTCGRPAAARRQRHPPTYPLPIPAQSRIKVTIFFAQKAQKTSRSGRPHSQACCICLTLIGFFTWPAFAHAQIPKIT